MYCGGRLRARGALRRGGGAAAPRVAFLRQKLRKNLFGKRFFVAQWGECEHGPPMPEGARPVFAEGKDRSLRGLSLRGPFIFWGNMLWWGDSSSNFDLSVCYDRGTRFTIIGRSLYLRLPLLRGGSRVAGGEDEKINDQIS